MLLDNPETIVGPGFSITLTLVPLGPGMAAILSLSLLASSELGVLGTHIVVVAPWFLNQLDLSGFIVSFLISLDL